MSWLPAVLHLLQGDPEHSGRVEGVAEGSREALPHRLHSLAASVRLHTEMPRTRSRRPASRLARHLPAQTRYHGWGASSNIKLRTTRTKQAENWSGTSPIFEAAVLIVCERRDEKSLKMWSDRSYSHQMRHADLADGSRWLHF